MIESLDEPVRRYLTHALPGGPPTQGAVRLTMSGRIKVGAWLPFTAEERCDATSFEWSARVGPRALRLLEVTDRYADGRGATSGRLLGRLPLFARSDRDSTRSAAARAALEAAVWAPASLLGADVQWRTESDGAEIVASWELPPERPAVHLRIDGDGRLVSAWAQRWGNSGQNGFGYIPCGCEVHAERRFGDVLVASRVSVGWWFGTSRYAPFFEAEVTELALV